MVFISPLSFPAAYPSGKRRSLTFTFVIVTVLFVLLICRLASAHMEPNTLLSPSESISAAIKDILVVLKLSVSGLKICIPTPSWDIDSGHPVCAFKDIQNTDTIAVRIPFTVFNFLHFIIH
jgi:hypothetical protein